MRRSVVLGPWPQWFELVQHMCCRLNRRYATSRTPAMPFPALKDRAKLTPPLRGEDPDRAKLTPPLRGEDPSSSATK